MNAIPSREAVINLPEMKDGACKNMKIGQRGRICAITRALDRAR